MTINNVTSLGVTPHFSKEAELHQRLSEVVGEYAGELSLVATLGVLELLKLKIIEDAK